MQLELAEVKAERDNGIRTEPKYAETEAKYLENVALSIY